MSRNEEHLNKRSKNIKFPTVFAGHQLANYACGGRECEGEGFVLVVYIRML